MSNFNSAGYVYVHAEEDDEDYEKIVELRAKLTAGHRFSNLVFDDFFRDDHENCFHFRITVDGVEYKLSAFWIHISMVAHFARAEFKDEDYAVALQYLLNVH